MSLQAAAPPRLVWFCVLCAAAALALAAPADEREWLAGDSHIHSHWSTRYTVEAALPAVDRDLYVRVRGTNTADLEPSVDGAGENPWLDLWFYSNPIFIEVE